LGIGKLESAYKSCKFSFHYHGRICALVTTLHCVVMRITLIYCVPGTQMLPYMCLVCTLVSYSRNDGNKDLL